MENRNDPKNGKILEHWAENTAVFVLAPFEPLIAQVEFPLMCWA
jgi:hypothetical protein